MTTQTLDPITNAALGDLARVPVKLPNRQAPVAAVFVPGGRGQLDSHVVIYPDVNGRDTFTVHYAVQNEDEQTVYLHQGSYDLTYEDAVRELLRRVTFNLPGISRATSPTPVFAISESTWADNVAASRS